MNKIAKLIGNKLDRFQTKKRHYIRHSNIQQKSYIKAISYLKNGFV